MLGVDTVLGLPLHVLVVHFAVVLIPLAAIGLIVTGWKKGWRKRYALPIALIAIAGAAAAFTAAQSGESLQHSVVQSAAASNQQVRLGEHPEQGDTAEVMAVIFAGAAVVFFAMEEWGDLMPLSVTQWSVVVGAGYVASAGLAIAALITIAIAGHSGATLVWKDMGNFVSPT